MFWPWRPSREKRSVPTALYGYWVAGAALESSLEVRNFADDFMRSYEKAENEVILNSGEKTMMKLYSGAGTAADTNLDDLRFAVFKQKAASNLTQVLPTSLPPTKAACQQHSLRVYFQVQTWKQLSPMS